MKVVLIFLAVFSILYAQNGRSELTHLLKAIEQPSFEKTSDFIEQLKPWGKSAQEALQHYAITKKGIIRSRCIKILVELFPLENTLEEIQFFFQLEETAQVFYLEQQSQSPSFEAFQWALIEQHELLPKPFLFLIYRISLNSNATENSRNLFRFQRIFKENQHPIHRIGSALFLTLQGSSYGLDFLISATHCACHQFHFQLRPFLLEALEGYYIEDPFSTLSWDQQMQQWWESAKLTFPISRQKNKFLEAFQKIFLGQEHFIEVPLVPFCECEECTANSATIPFEDVHSVFESQHYKGLVAFAIGVYKRTLSVKIRIQPLSPSPIPEDILQEWKKLIEQMWSDRYYLQGTQHHWQAYCLNERYGTYQVRIEVEFTDKSPHHRIQIGYYPSLSGHQGLWNLKWATGTDGRFRNAPAHEVGHMLGNYDEYAGGATRPDGKYAEVPESIMGTRMSKVYPRHYHIFQEWLSKKLQKPFKVIQKIKKNK